MEIELIVAAHMRVAPGVLRRGAAMDAPVRLPIPVYVVDTGAERILVDCGPPRGIAPVGPFTVEEAAGVGTLVDLDRVTLVVLTHLHFDHAGGLRDVPAHVPVVLQRAEWDGAHDPAAAARNVIRDEDVPADREVRLVDGDTDLLGDGRVQLLATPGHTPGHQSILLDDRLVIGGDVAPFGAALDDGRLPVFGDDLEAQAASARRLAALRDRGVRVLPGHDPEVLRAGAV